MMEVFTASNGLTVDQPGLSIRPGVFSRTAHGDLHFEEDLLDRAHHVKQLAAHTAALEYWDHVGAQQEEAELKNLEHVAFLAAATHDDKDWAYYACGDPVWRTVAVAIRDELRKPKK